jgi:hypothetical protein
MEKRPQMPVREFTIEGALHLFSGLPSALCPAEIFQAADDDQLRAQLAGCNLYLVTCRRRILVDPRSIDLSGDTITGRLCVARDGWVALPFRFRLSFEHHLGRPESLEVMASTGGTHVAVRRGNATIFIASHVIVAQAECDLTAEERDLHILYVGQGVGRTRSRLAIDRLSSHATLQRILADMHTYHPDTEVLLLLYRFDRSRMIMSTGGDMNLEVAAGAEEDGLHLKRLCDARIDRRARISLAEAALINYFQPPYNVTFRKTNFAAQRKLKLLREVIGHDLTGLIVEVCSHNLRSRLRTETRPPVELDTAIVEGYQRLSEEPGELAERARQELEQILHTHNASFPLTLAEERDTFLHGTRWLGTSERQPFL